MATFQPKLTKQQTQQYVTHYYDFPDMYDDDSKGQIEAHATYYSLPFYKENRHGNLLIKVTAELPNKIHEGEQEIYEKLKSK